MATKREMRTVIDPATGQEKQEMFQFSINRNNTASSRKRGMDKPNAASRKRMEKESRRINRRK